MQRPTTCLLQALGKPISSDEPSFIYQYTDLLTRRLTILHCLPPCRRLEA